MLGGAYAMPVKPTGDELGQDCSAHTPCQHRPDEREENRSFGTTLWGEEVDDPARHYWAECPDQSEARREKHGRQPRGREQG